MKRIISLGGGVQSSTMYLMAAEGLLGEAPDVAVFADTGWESRATYAHIEYLRSLNLSIPIHTVSVGYSIRERSLNGGATRNASLPLHCTGKDGRHSMVRRQCTTEYKIIPIRRFAAELVGKKYKPNSIEMWIGISRDEATRMKDSLVKYIRHRYPLIEKMMSRYDCVKWLEQNGYAVPEKSACIGCPFHDDAY